MQPKPPSWLRLHPADPDWQTNAPNCDFEQEEECAMNIRRTAMLMAVAVMGVLSVVPPATAATPSTFGALVPSTFTQEYASGRIPLTGDVSVPVSCPAGKAAVSVGGLAEGLYSITPGPNYDGGVVSAHAVNGNTGQSIVANATCAPTEQFAGTTVGTREQHAHSTTGEWTATKTCPAGMRAFGGGGYFRTRNGAVSADQFFLSASTPTLDGRGWTVSALNNTFTDTLVVTTRCAFQSTSTRLVEEIYPVVPERPGAVGRAQGYAHCPAGFLPISGGAHFTQDGSASAAHAQLSVSTPVDNGQIGWFANGTSGGEHAQLHVLALCGS
ncbi:hypothetical protein [Actinomadura sp. 6N118]|uniref:hypothetical protein n=1 Tax=Actinomadura sp. 6N118 TaxID=3375151 RepID=UPI0037B25484